MCLQAWQHFYGCWCRKVLLTYLYLSCSFVEFTTHKYVKCRSFYFVGNPRFIMCRSYFHHPWVTLNNVRLSEQIFINTIHQIRRYRSGALQFRVHYRIWIALFKCDNISVKQILKSSEWVAWLSTTSLRLNNHTWFCRFYTHLIICQKICTKEERWCTIDFVPRSHWNIILFW